MSSRYVYGISLLLALTAAYACWCRAPMIWDGAYQFNATLIMQRPYFYLTRFHTFFLWWPTVWASRFTTNITLLQSIYGLPFLLAPVLAVLLSWWMVHKHAPHLIIWVIFGVAAGSLPGQIFVINDSIFQLHLFWPIFLGLFVPLSIPKKIVIGVLAIFQFVHPLGVILFFGAACAVTAVGFVKSERRLTDSILFIAGISAFAMAVGGILRQFQVLSELTTLQLLLSACVLGLLAILPRNGWHRVPRIRAIVVLPILTTACFLVPVHANERTGVLVIILAIALGLAVAGTSTRPRMFARAGVVTALFIFALGKIYVTNHIPALYDGYAAEEARLSTAIDRWGVGVRGWPLHGLWFMWAAAAMLFLLTHWRGRLSKNASLWLLVLLEFTLTFMAWKHRFDVLQAIFGAVACIIFYLFLLQFRRVNGPRPIVKLLPLFCIAIGMACWIYWASDGRLWWKAIDYRRWVGPLTAPFFLLTMLDALADAKSQNRKMAGFGFPVVLAEENSAPSKPVSVANVTSPSHSSLRTPIALMLAMTFAIVLGLQSTLWHRASARMMTQVRNYPGSIVPESALPWMDGTPLDHWAVSDYVMAMQGKTPRKLLLDPRAEEHLYENPPKIPHWDFYPGAKADHPDPTPGPVGWFDLRPLLLKLQTEPRAKNGAHERLDRNSTPE